MPGASKVGESIAGGLVSGPGADSVFIEGVPLSVVGDLIASHGVALHAAAEMVSGSTIVIADGRPACKEGDLASCGHPVTFGAFCVFINS